MKHLFSTRDRIAREIKYHQILLFLDYDGTLAAIVDHYKSAKILQESKMLLRQIARNPQCRVAIVSGRSLSDVKKRVGLKNIIYVGNHGLEAVGPGIQYTSFVKIGVKSLFRKIKYDLKKHVGKIDGISIEDKNLTLSIHYRRIDRKDLVLFKKIFLKSVQPYLENQEIVINTGKKVFEIKPAVEWNKGSAVLWLMKRLKKNGTQKKVLPIFIGDDLTDEKAFLVLRNKGLCVRVGCRKSSVAQYCLRDVKQVARFLRMILECKSNPGIHRGA